MAVASAKKAGGHGGREGSGKTPSGHTPGRRGRTGNQYFEVGKVGRKTGITLKDTGIRDEYGMEPVSGIFSSPVKEPESPPKRGDGTLSSDAMAMQDSSAPDVDETLHMRKTPRLPPPRASTPKHTNIGSPRRMSSARQQSKGPDAPMASEASPDRTSSHPPPNRLLNFSNREGVRVSIEDGSPFKPKRVLRRSTGGDERADPFMLDPTLEQQDAKLAGTTEVSQTVYEQGDESEQEEVESANGEQREQSQPPPMDDQTVDDAPPTFANDEDDYDATRHSIRDNQDISEALTHAEHLLASPSVMPSTKRKPGRPRKSGDSVNTTQVHQTPTVISTVKSNKRDITSIEHEAAEEEDQSISQVSVSGQPSAKRTRGRPRKSDITVHTDAADQTAIDQTIDPQLLAHGDSYLAPVNEDSDPSPAPSPAQPPKTTKPKGKPGRKPRAPKERDPNISIRRTISPPKSSHSEDGAPRSPSKRATSVSNVNLRASTPFEDASQHVSRSGRPILKPLKHWAGESYVWKNGQVEGVIRADEVKNKKSGGGKKKGRKGRGGARAGGRAGSNNLDSIAEESEAESMLPDEWEEQVGVIAGTIASWDPVAQAGNARDTVREDLAFASSSIITREVAGSAFQYAKINTLPFFGSGVVELAPEGFKRAKNSRKMQMVFFVHEGKVLVTVGPPAGDGQAGGAKGRGRRGSEEGVEVNEFAISKGGVWVVPRGNNYSITNESRTKSARIFFAQGCEVEGGDSQTQ